MYGNGAERRTAAEFTSHLGPWVRRVQSLGGRADPGSRRAHRACGRRELRAPLVVLAAAAALACVPGDREIRLERLAADRRALEETFDRLEHRLTANHARVRFWREIEERRESVSATACVAPDPRTEQLWSRMAPTPRPSRHRARVASARALPRDVVTPKRP
jgi:hypothetical protein